MASSRANQLLFQRRQSSLSLPGGVYIYTLVQSGNDALAAISSDNSLRRFDRRTLQLLPDGVIEDTHPAQRGGVACLCEVGVGNGGANDLLATAGGDGTVKLWDVRSGSRNRVVEFSTGK
jgi:WD40 repeat protein